MAHRGRRAHARRRRARRPDQAVQGAAAEALLRHARLGAVRPDLRAARVLPDPHRAGDPRDPRRRHRRGGGRPRSCSSSAPATATKTRVLLDAMAEAGTLRRYLPFDVAESVVRQTAEDLIEEYPGLDVYGVVGRLRAPPGPGPAVGGPAHDCLPGRHDRQLPARQPPPLPARDRGPHGARRPAPARHRPGQGPRDHPPRLRRRPGDHGRVQPQPAARGQPRAAARTSTPTASSTSRCSTPSASGSRCACARCARPR